MEPLILQRVDNAARVFADMTVEDVVTSSGVLRDLGDDVHALITCSGESESIAFLVTSIRSANKFRKLQGRTIPIEMVGWFRGNGRFEADMLHVRDVWSLRNGLYSPRMRVR